MKKIKNLLICFLLVGAFLSINGQILIEQTFQKIDSLNIKKDSICNIDSAKCLTDSIKEKNEQLEKLLQFLEETRPGIVIKKPYKRKE